MQLHFMDMKLQPFVQTPEFGLAKLSYDWIQFAFLTYSILIDFMLWFPLN